VSFTRNDSLEGDVTGTLAALSGIFSGAGAGPDGLRIGSNGNAEFTYVFRPSSRGTFTENLAFDLASLGVDGFIELKGTGVGPSVAGLGPDGVAGNLDFTTAATGVSSGPRTVVFSITNDTTDIGPLDLVGLTLQEAVLSGPGAELFTLTGFVPGTVLSPGEMLQLMLTFDPETLAASGVSLSADLLEETLLTIITDMGTEFGGRDGQTLTYRLNWDFLVGVISEPAVGGLLALAVVGLIVLRRRRSQN